jgi:hypothetical protein
VMRGSGWTVGSLSDGRARVLLVYFLHSGVGHFREALRFPQFLALFRCHVHLLGRDFRS